MSQRVRHDLGALGRFEASVDDHPITTPHLAETPYTLHQARHGLIRNLDVQLCGESLQFHKLLLCVHMLVADDARSGEVRQGPGRPPTALARSRLAGGPTRVTGTGATGCEERLAS